MALAVLSAAGAWPRWPSQTGWLALAVTAVSLLANWASPSRPERWFWGPISLAMFACSLWVMVA